MNTSEGDVLQEEKQEVENPVMNQNDQMGPVMAMLNQLQQQLVSAQAEITALKNKEAVPPEPAPVSTPVPTPRANCIQKLSGLEYMCSTRSLACSFGCQPYAYRISSPTSMFFTLHREHLVRPTL